MNWAQIHKVSNKLTCQNEGHEHTEVLGFCLFYQCQNPPPFCVNCLTVDKDEYHLGHVKSQLKGFRDILKIINKEIITIQQLEDGFKKISQLIIGGQTYIEKILLHKSNKLIKKLQEIEKKVEPVIEKIFQKKHQLAKFEQSLTQQNYIYVRDNIKQLKLFLLQKQQCHLFEIINMVLQQQEKQLWKLQNAILNNLNSKVTQIYFLKNTVYSDSDLKIFYGISQEELFQKAMTQLNQLLIKNPQLTSAQIWKSLKELEKIWKASIFDYKTNRVYQNDIIDQEKSVIYLDQNSDALNLLDEIIRSDPETELSNCIKSKLLEVKSNFEGSIECFDEAIQQDPYNAQFYNNKGIFLHQFDKLELSSKLFDEAIQLNPKNPVYHINKGCSLISQGENDDSIVHFNKAIILESIYPSQSQAIHLEVIRQQSLKMNSKARNYKQIHQFPLMLAEQTKLKQDDAEIYLYKGNSISSICQEMFYKIKVIILMRLYYDVTLLLRSDHAIASNDKGYSLHYLQKYQKAIENFEEAIRLEPNNSQYYNNIGNSLEKLEKYQDAIKFYNEAISLKSDCADFYFNKGMVLDKLEQYENAIKCYNYAIELNTNCADFYNNKGLALKILKFYEDSLESYEQKTIKLKPYYADFYNNKGLALYKLEQYEDAIKCFEKAIKLKPKEALFYNNNKNQSLEKLQQYQNAVKGWNDTIELNPKSTFIEINKATAIHELSKQKEAVFDNYGKNYISNPFIEQALQKSKQNLVTIKGNNETVSLKSIFTLTQKNNGIAIKYELKDYRINTIDQLQKRPNDFKSYDSYAIRFQQGDDANYYVTIGNNLQKYQDHQNAIQWYDKAIKLKPESATAYYNKGNSLHILQKYQDAIICYEEAIRLKRNQSIYNKKKGLTLTKLKIYDDLFEGCDEAIRFNEQSDFYFNYKTQRIDKDTDYLNIKGQHYQDAIKYFNEAIRLRKMLCLAYNNKGYSLQKLLKFQDAIICYDEAIQLDPTDSIPYFNKANSLSELQLYLNAIMCYDDAIRLNSNNPNYFAKKGDTLQKLQQHLDAIYCYDQTIILQPNNAIVYNLKGYSLHELQKYQSAINCYDTAISFKSNDADFYYNKGLALHELKQYQHALNYYNEAIRLKPDDTDYHNEKGNILQELQLHQAAIEYYDQAIRLKPDNAQAYNNKGYSLNEQGNHLEAIKFQNKALRLDSLQAHFYNDKASTLVALSIQKQAFICYKLGFLFSPSNDETLTNKYNLIATI